MQKILEWWKEFVNYQVTVPSNMLWTEWKFYPGTILVLLLYLLISIYLLYTSVTPFIKFCLSVRDEKVKDKSGEVNPDVYARRSDLFEDFVARWAGIIFIGLALIWLFSLV